MKFSNNFFLIAINKCFNSNALKCSPIKKSVLSFMAICLQLITTANAQVIKVGSIQKPVKTNTKIGTPVATSKAGMKKISDYSFTSSSAKMNSRLGLLASSLSKTRTLPDGTKLVTTFYMNPSLATNRVNAEKGLQEKRNKKPDTQKDGWVCTNTQVKVSLDDESFMNASNEQQSANLYPGAVYTFDNFMSGAFKNETAARNPIRITTSAQGVSGNVYEDVENPTPDEIKNAVNKLYRRMPQSRTMTSYQSTIYECNSLADQMLKINAGGGGYGFKADFGYSTKNKEEHRYFLIDCTQEMYSVNAEMPTVGVFTNPEDAKKTGLMMMNNVTYGHRVLVSFDTKISSHEQGLKFDASYSGFGASANFGIQSLVNDASSETTVKMYIVGGQNVGLISLTKNDILNKLNEFFRTTSLQNAKPIKYQFRNMNNEVVVSHSATDFFPEQHCVPAAADPSAIKWEITITLNNIRNETNPNEDIHLGIHQMVQVHSNGKFLLPDNYSDNINGYLIYWAGYPLPKTPYEEQRTFKGSTNPGKTMSWVVSQKGIEDGATMDLISNYIAMISTRIGGHTDESTRKYGDKYSLKDLMTNAYQSKNFSINFNKRVFTFSYTLQAQKIN